jgi:hypothetical protein
VVVAPTGTGKTLAYMLPAIPHVLARSAPLRVGEGPLVLVVVPTRELASQVEGVCVKMFKLFALRCVALYGGIAKSEQLDRLLAPTHIVVATPGECPCMHTNVCDARFSIHKLSVASSVVVYILTAVVHALTATAFTITHHHFNGHHPPPLPSPLTHGLLHRCPHPSIHPTTCGRSTD